jgi:outer membrane scaffolding protein for murein synthesis (MipA/OmpV family)
MASLCVRLAKVPRNAYICLKQTATEYHWSIKYALFSEEGQLTIGAASITSSNIYAGASNETRALPDLKYSKGDLCLERTKMARGFFNFSLLMS